MHFELNLFCPYSLRWRVDEIILQKMISDIEKL